MSSAVDESVVKAAEKDPRVDERAADVLVHYGYKGKLPDDLVFIYNEFVRNRAVLFGRQLPLSPDGFAFVVTLFTLMGKKD